MLTPILRAVEKLRFSTPQGIVLPGKAFHDRRKMSMKAHGPQREWKVRSRLMKDVTGECWHQAGVDLGENPARYDSVGAHVCVTLDCQVIWLHDWDVRGAFANGWNNGTVSIEVSGNFPGQRNGTTWNKKPPNIVTPELKQTCIDVAHWIKEDANARGARINVYVAHRQSSATRPGDPGFDLYSGVVIPAAEADGVGTAPTTVLDDGRPIPEEWDPRQKGVKY
jgi:hypothetical protein